MVRGLQIGRQRPLPPGIAPPEGLHREIIVLQVEVAGQLLQPRFQHAVHPLVSGQRLILRRRNPQAEKRSRLARQPLHEGTVEYRSEEHTSELQSLMRISYAVFCLKKKK